MHCINSCPWCAGSWIPACGKLYVVDLLLFTSIHKRATYTLLYKWILYIYLLPLIIHIRTYIYYVQASSIHSLPYHSPFIFIHMYIYSSFTPLHYPSHHSNHSSLSSISFPSTTYSLLHLFRSFPAGTTLWPNAGNRTQRTDLPSSNWQTSWSLIMSAWSVPVCALMTICQTLKKRENSSKEAPTDIGCEGLLWNQWVPLISSMNQPCWDTT